jgi:putative transposase
MKKSRYTEEQVIQILKESEAGVATAELCRQHGISPATLYKWKSKYRGMDVPDVKKMRQLEDENSKLKRMVADQALDIQALKMVISKKF